MSAPTVSQYAAIEAMRNGDRDIEHMREEYDSRRRYLVENLRRIGLSCFEPKGAFYVFPGHPFHRPDLRRVLRALPAGGAGGRHPRHRLRPRGRGLRPRPATPPP